MEPSRAIFLWAALALVATPTSGQSPEPAQDTEKSAPAAEPTLPRGAVVLRISEQYLERLFARDIDQKSAVNNEVLGTRARGEAHTVAHADVDLDPDNNGAAFCIVTKGATTARTTGHNGPAVIYSRTVTNWTCRTEITFSNNTFHTRPATIESRTTLVPLGVGSELPGIRGSIVKRVANRRVDQSHAEAQAITTRKVRRKILAQLDADVDAQVAKLNRRLHAHPLVSRALGFVEKEGLVKLASCRECVTVSFSDSESASAAVCPVNLLTPSDTEVWVHSSYLAEPTEELPTGLEQQLAWVAKALPRVELPPLEDFDLKSPSELSMQTVEDWLVISWTDDDNRGTTTTAARVNPSASQKR